MRVLEVYTNHDSHITIGGRNNVRHLVENDGSDGRVRVAMTLDPRLAAIRIEEGAHPARYVPVASVMQFRLAEEPQTQPQKQENRGR